MAAPSSSGAQAAGSPTAPAGAAPGRNPRPPLPPGASDPRLRPSPLLGTHLPIGAEGEGFLLRRRLQRPVPVGVRRAGGCHGSLGLVVGVGVGESPLLHLRFTAQLQLQPLGHALSHLSRPPARLPARRAGGDTLRPAERRLCSNASAAAAPGYSRPRLQPPSRERWGWVRRAAVATVPAAAGPSGPPQGGGAAGPDPELPKPNFGGRQGKLRRRGSARRPLQPGRGSGERGGITACSGAERGRGRGRAPPREEAARPPAQAGWHRCKARPSASSSPAGASVPPAAAAAGRTPGGGAGLPPAPLARPPAAGASRRPAHLRGAAAAAGGARTAPGAGSTPPAPSPGSSAAAAGPRSSAGSPRARLAGPRPAPAGGRDAVLGCRRRPPLSRREEAAPRGEGGWSPSLGPPPGCTVGLAAFTVLLAGGSVQQAKTY